MKEDEEATQRSISGYFSLVPGKPDVRFTWEGYYISWQIMTKGNYVILDLSSTQERILLSLNTSVLGLHDLKKLPCGGIECQTCDQCVLGAAHIGRVGDIQSNKNLLVQYDFEKKSALVLDKRKLTLLATLELQGSAGDPILPPRDSWSIFYLEQPNANQHTTLTEVRYNTMHT